MVHAKAHISRNASSLPPRLPFLSAVLKAVKSMAAADNALRETKFSIVAVSYRGFWTSRGRPSQRGIELDAAAALQWVVERYDSEGANLRLIIWGQSIGAGVATTAAGEYINATQIPSGRHKRPRIRGLILETPFTSVRDMLEALYPQKWLPYRYLSPFLRSSWNSKVAIQKIAQSSKGIKPKVLILQAGRDEVVPAHHSLQIAEYCIRNGFDVEQRAIAGALHTEVMSRGDGIKAVAGFLVAGGYF